MLPTPCRLTVRPCGVYTLQRFLSGNFLGFFSEYDILPSSIVYMDAGGDRHVSNVKGPDAAPDRNRKFEQLVDRYQGSVLHMCYLYLCDKSLAEDAVQDTFLKVYQGMDAFRGESSEKTWIMKIAMNTCYNINHSGWFRFLNRRVTPEMMPNSAVQTDEEDEELTVAVTKLPLRLREVILLHYYQGMKVNDIADTLGISQSTVSGRLKRGRDKLKNLLEGRELDE